MVRTTCDVFHSSSKIISQGQSHALKTTYNVECSGRINGFTVAAAASTIDNCHYII
jgi:hypothetical protein